MRGTGDPMQRNIQYKPRGGKHWALDACQVYIQKTQPLGPCNTIASISYATNKNRFHSLTNAGPTRETESLKRKNIKETTTQENPRSQANATVNKAGQGGG